MTATALVLDFEKHRLHALQRGGLIWFVLADVCEALGLDNPSMVAVRLDADQKNTLKISEGNRGNPNVTIVSEDAVYEIACTSRKPIAKRFKRWLYREVLPEIRRTGNYQGSSAPLDALIGSLQPELDLLPVAPDLPTVTRGDDNVVRVTHEEPLRWQRESEQDDIQAGDLFEAPHPNQWSPSYDTWRERTIESTLPRPTGFLDTIGKIGRTPQGYGDSTEDKPTMFLRDELPIGHSADSWRVWVSEQWFRLPLDLRQRWWRDTEYGNRPPSDEMIQAIIFIALP
jgi:prophage antirepressor-like protein